MKASFVLVVIAASAVLAKPWPINRPGAFPNAPSQAHDPFPSDPNRPIKAANARPTGDPPVTYLKCETPAGPYHINAGGEAQIGYGSKIASVGAGKLINLYDRSSVTGLVHAGSSIDIGDKVALPTQMVHLPNKLDVSFDSDNHQYVQICDGALAPLACTDASYTGCFSCNVAAHVYSSTDDLDVWENQNVRLDIAQKSEFRDLEVHSRAKLYLATPGSYYFQNVHFREDTTLVLGADGDYKLFVENNADFDERFRLQHGRATTFTVIQTDDTGSGYVKIDNAPANRDHELRLNIIQRGRAINGGYVQIGHHQRIRGYISSLGDVFVLYGVSMVPGDCPA